MYDEKKLNAYWDRMDRIRAEWYKNGWNGERTSSGRDITFSCGHLYWAAYGVANPRPDELCWECRAKNANR